MRDWLKLSRKHSLVYGAYDTVDSEQAVSETQDEDLQWEDHWYI